MNQGSCHHSAAALAAGELIGQKVGPVRKADPFQHFIYLRRICFPLTTQCLGKFQILPQRQSLDQTGILEQETNLLTAKRCLLSVGHGHNVLSIKENLAVISLQQCADDIQQGTFAHAGGTFYSNEVTTVYSNIDIFQRGDDLTHPIVLVNVFQSADFHISSPHPG